MTDSVSRKARAGGHRLLRAAATVLAVHGLTHLLGFALLWRWGQPGGLRDDDVSPAAGSRPGMVVGGVRLAATLLFPLTAVLPIAVAAAVAAAHRSPGRLAAGGPR